jgi:hypothetical protein
MVTPLKLATAVAGVATCVIVRWYDECQLLY